MPQALKIGCPAGWIWKSGFRNLAIPEYLFLP